MQIFFSRLSFCFKGPVHGGPAGELAGGPAGGPGGGRGPGARGGGGLGPHCYQLF